MRLHFLKDLNRDTHLFDIGSHLLIVENDVRLLSFFCNIAAWRIVFEIERYAHLVEFFTVPGLDGLVQGRRDAVNP